MLLEGGQSDGQQEVSKKVLQPNALPHHLWDSLNLFPVVGWHKYMRKGRAGWEIGSKEHNCCQDLPPPALEPTTTPSLAHFPSPKAHKLILLPTYLHQCALGGLLVLAGSHQLFLLAAPLCLAAVHHL